MGDSAPVITIDPMRLRDLPDIMKLEKLSFTIPWSRQAFYSELLENERAYYLVAKCAQRAVGYIGIWLLVGEGHITNVAVHPDFRRQGIGRRLLQSIQELALARNTQRLTLEVRRSNLVAQHLYKQMGYVSVGIRPGYYQDNNEDAIIMWKTIAGGA